MNRTIQFVLATAGEPTLADRALLGYAREFLSGPVHVVEAPFPEGLRGKIRELESSGPVCLALGAGSLAAWVKDSGEDRPFLGLESCPLHLVFGCEDSAEISKALRAFTGGAVTGISTVTSRSGEISIPSGPPEVPEALSGIRSPLGREVVYPVLDPGGGSAVSLMELEGRPVFARVDREGGRTYLVSGNFPDPETPLTVTEDIDKYYEGLLPLMMFLRAVFPDTCWSGSGRGSRLIIDDPLIRPRYGHLDYDRLLQSMDRVGYRASIAFIPWNHRRTRRDDARRIVEESSRLSVCFHGCDHTWDEFGTRDLETLRRKSHLAFDRMESHRLRTGVRPEGIMVFPQGRFSAEAPRALGEAGFMAVVDSVCLPALEYEGGQVRLLDLLFPAITRFSGFPIFKRFYPRRTIDFAFGLFVGRPALVTAHHGDFRDGGDRLENFMGGLVERAGSGSERLEEDLIRTFLERTAPDGVRRIRFFTREFAWRNRGSDGMKVLFEKPEPSGDDIETVEVDGETVPYDIDGGVLRFGARVDPDREVRVRVGLRNAPPPRLGSPGLKYEARVAARRYLSEFRDHTLSRHPRLARVAASMARAAGLVSKPS